MKLPAIIRTSFAPLMLFLVMATLLAITLVSPARPANVARNPEITSASMPPQPPAPPTQLVPVLAAATRAGPPVPGEQVALRQLIIATDSNDFELAAWK